MIRIKVRWIIYFFLLPINLILYSWVIASDGGFRSKKKVVFKSNVHKLLFGFPIWIEQIDRSYLCINAFNEIMVAASVISWFLLDMEQKKYLLQKFPMIGIIILFTELFWGVAVGILAARDGKDTIYIRKTIDLQENQGSVTVGDSIKYTYHYVYTHLKEEKAEKLVIILPESYFITQDMNGNYRMLLNGRYETVTNMGTYEELSDYLVRAGYGTLRCERELEEIPETDTGSDREEVDFGQLFLKVLQKESYEGKIYLLAHGRSNSLLMNISDTIPMDGVVSLCGAGMGVHEEFMHLIVWSGRSKKKVEKKYNKFLSSRQPPKNYQYVDKIKEEFINWLAVKKIPVFIGYVQADPYYDEDIAKEIEGYHLQNVKILKFAGTDFTFRECRVNKRRQVALMGYAVASLSRLPRMNPIVAEEVTAWLNTH